MPVIKLGGLLLAVSDSSLASAGRLALCAPEGRIAPIGASRLRRSLTARLRRDGLIPKKSAEGGRRRDEPGKENVELKNCIALVVI